MALKKTKFWRAPETLGHGRSIQMVLASAPAVSCMKNRQRTETTSPSCLFCTLISPDTPVEEENGGEEARFRVRESHSTAGWWASILPSVKWAQSCSPRTVTQMEWAHTHTHLCASLHIHAHLSWLKWGFYEAFTFPVYSLFRYLPLQFYF